MWDRRTGGTWRCMLSLSRSCLSVLTALLFSFLSCPSCPGDLSVASFQSKFVVRPPLVWWISFRELPASPLLPRATLPCRQRASQVIVFFSSIPGRSQGGCAPLSVSEAAPWTCSCTCFTRVVCGVRALLEVPLLLTLRGRWKALAHTQEGSHGCPLSCGTTKPLNGCHQSCGVVTELTQPLLGSSGAAAAPQLLRPCSIVRLHTV